MPIETQNAVNWALIQNFVWAGTEEEYSVQVTKDTPLELVSKVREYFNANNIVYQSFSFNNLIPYLPN